MSCFIPLTPSLLLAIVLIVNERLVFHSFSLTPIIGAFLRTEAQIDRCSTRRAHKIVQPIESEASFLFLLPMLPIDKKCFHFRRPDVFSRMCHCFASLDIDEFVLNVFSRAIWCRKSKLPTCSIKEHSGMRMHCFLLPALLEYSRTRTSLLFNRSLKACGAAFTGSSASAGVEANTSATTRTRRTEVSLMVFLLDMIVGRLIEYCLSSEGVMFEG